MNEEEIRQFMTLLHKWRDLTCSHASCLDYRFYDLIINDVSGFFYRNFWNQKKPTVKEVMDNPFIRNLGPSSND